jgi:hypothetical protein
MKNIEILQKVADLVGFKFSTHAFAEVELVGGVRITNSTEGDFLVGDTISILNEDGTSSVVGEGTHELLDGRVFLTDSEGKLVEIRENDEEADTEGAPGSVEASKKKRKMEEVEIEVPDEVADAITPEVVEEVVEAVVDALVPIVEELKVLTEEMKKMRKDYEAFKASSAYTPLKEDKKVSSAFSDHRYEVLKAMKKSMK